MFDEWPLRPLRVFMHGYNIFSNSIAPVTLGKSNGDECSGATLVKTSIAWRVQVLMTPPAQQCIPRLCQSL